MYVCAMCVGDLLFLLCIDIISIIIPIYLKAMFIYFNKIKRLII